MISQTEENYLKAIFKLSEKSDKPVSTNAVSKELSTSAASVTDMLIRLSKKDLVIYAKYKGVTLSDEGSQLAKHLVRKHRLWEVFLYDKLGFTWDEVHDIAEQMEHIRSKKLVDRLDDFLGKPKFDPHGDPIPDAEGNFAERQQSLLSTLNNGDHGIVVGVQEHSSTFLQYLDKLELVLGAEVEILDKYDYDDSVKILLNQEKEQTITNKVAQNIFLKRGKRGE